MDRLLEKTLKGLMISFFVALPFQIKKNIFLPEFFLSGHFDFYQNIAIYFTDILLIISFVIYGIYLIRHPLKTVHFGPKFIQLLFLITFILIEINSIMKGVNEQNTLTILLRSIEWFGLYMLILNEVAPIKIILLAIIGSISVQSVLALLQLASQHSIGLHFLGEPLLSVQQEGIAKIALNSTKLIRSYGTTPHPNILGGFIVLSLFFTWFTIKNIKLRTFLTITQILGLFSTFSRSALLGLGGALLAGIMFMKISVFTPKIKKKTIIKMIGGLCLIIFIAAIINIESIPAWKERFNILNDKKAISERLLYLEGAYNMTKSAPVFGQGVGAFTRDLQRYVDVKIAPWEIQPVHNIFALISSELGIIGLVLTMTFLIYAFKKINIERKKFSKREHRDETVVIFLCLTAVTIIMLFDHYFITIHEGQILLVTIIGLLAKKIDTSTKSHSIKTIRKI